MALNVDQTSSDYQNSIEYWNLVNTIDKGTPAMRASTYLTRFDAETIKDYRARREAAKFTNIFGDIIDNLAARPFSKEIKIEADAAITSYMEDIDGMKTHVHKFTARWFKSAVKKGIAWVFVDYTKVNPMTIGTDGTPRRKTAYEERTSGARPYATLVQPENVLAAYSVMINGVEKFVHVRFREVSTELVDYKEVTTERIREFNRAPILDDVGEIVGYDAPAYVIFKKVSSDKKGTSWEIEDSGPLTIGEIPMEALIIGERDEGWHVVAAMNDVAWMQLDYFEQENGLKNLKTLTAFPMLTASGVTPPMQSIKDDDGNVKQVPMKAPVGPRAVLYGPANDISGVAGSWSFIEPAGTSLTFLKSDLAEAEKQMRELGRQPLTANSGNLTVVTTAFAAAKGNSAIQAWALDCKDSLEVVLMYMGMWTKATKEPTVTIPLDFSLDFEQDKSFASVENMRKNGDLSRKTYWAEAQRRKILSDDFDADKEEDNLEDELPGEDEAAIDGLLRDSLPVEDEDEEMSPAEDGVDNTQENEAA